MPVERRPGAAERAAAMGLTIGVLCSFSGAWGISPAPTVGAKEAARRAATTATATGSWTLLGPPQPGGLSAFALSPQSARRIYAIHGATLHTTADGGATWTSLPVPPSDNDSCFGLLVAVDPQQPEGIYLTSQAFSLGGHSSNFLSHSTNGGASWTTLPVPAPTVPAWVSVDPQSPLILYTGPPMARSADGGISWTQPAGLPFDVANVVIDPSSPSNVYALASDSPSLYKSADRGVTWTLAGATMGNIDWLAVDPNSSSTLFAATGGFLDKSVDGGATWTTVYAPGTVDQHGVTAVTLAPTFPTTVYAVILDGAPVGSIDGGLTWTPLPTAGLTGAILDLQIDPQDPRRLIASVNQQGLAAMTVPGPCMPGALGTSALCLGTGGRFLVTASWQTAQSKGVGQGVALTTDAGAFWFFSAANLELLVKVLDGCALNGHYWAFAAGLTDVGVTISVTDTQTGQSRTYVNTAGTPFPALQDTTAFDACP